MSSPKPVAPGLGNDDDDEDGAEAQATGSTLRGRCRRPGGRPTARGALPRPGHRRYPGRDGPGRPRAASGCCRPSAPQRRRLTPRQPVPTWLTVVLVGAPTLLIILIMSGILGTLGNGDLFRFPQLLVANTPTGGDMGAHVLLPQVLLQVLLLDQPSLVLVLPLVLS